MEIEGQMHAARSQTSFNKRSRAVDCKRVSSAFDKFVHLGSALQNLSFLKLLTDMKPDKKR
jgi:hypothetical protein